MAVRDWAPQETSEQIRRILREHPPIRKLEEILGPEPEGEDPTAEVDAFLEERKRWKAPYVGTNER
jgi:hypothetical protein